MADREIITRGRLPHWYVRGAMHFVTYRVAGTIPLAVLEKLREQRMQRIEKQRINNTNDLEHLDRVHKQFFAAYDAYLDNVSKIDWLAQPKIAAIIRDNLYHHDGSKYHLLAYCIMPNHVHILFQPIELMDIRNGERQIDENSDVQSPLAKIMHSLKSYTAKKINLELRRIGRLWQPESYDHWVRDEEELERVVTYIVYNPVKAGLVNEPHAWHFSSAHDRFLIDGSTCGYLPIIVDA